MGYTYIFKAFIAFTRNTYCFVPSKKNSGKSLSLPSFLHSNVWDSEQPHILIVSLPLTTFDWLRGAKVTQLQFCSPILLREAGTEAWILLGHRARGCEPRELQAAMWPTKLSLMVCSEKATKLTFWENKGKKPKWVLAAVPSPHPGFPRPSCIHVLPVAWRSLPVI